MKSYVTLPREAPPPLPAEFDGPEIRYSESLVRYFLEAFTKPGDVVFDPFAGFGTTLRVAEEMGRNGYGIEFNWARRDYACRSLRHPERLRHGDAQRLAEYDLPPLDFSLTSPPFMARADRENPLTDYATPVQSYARYLADLREIYTAVGSLLKPNAHAVLEVSNLKMGGTLTTLAWDIARSLSEVLCFEGEIVIAWEGGYGYGYDHSYGLVFRKPV